MTADGKPWRRRTALAGGALAVTGWVIGAPRLAALWSPALTYRNLPGLTPFRELTGAGKLSTANGALLGLDEAQPVDRDRDARVAAVQRDPCKALFGTGSDPRVPVAFFSDFNCPNCRVLETILADYEAANPGVLRLIRFELPLLGTASTTASKAVLAADRQGGYIKMHDRLMRSRMVTDLNLVMSIAEAVGLDGQKLVTDMQSPEIDTALDQSKAIATVFGFYGTPGTVIGRTVFLGAIPAADVAQIITSELALPKLSCRSQ